MDNLRGREKDRNMILAPAGARARVFAEVFDTWVSHSTRYIVAGIVLRSVYTDARARKKAAALHKIRRRETSQVCSGLSIYGSVVTRVYTLPRISIKCEVPKNPPKCFSPVGSTQREREEGGGGGGRPRRSIFFRNNLIVRKVERKIKGARALLDFRARS